MDNWFKVEPIDTTWYRSGKPFVAGENSFDGGLFPPTPWSFQGLIRSQILRKRAGARGIDALGPKQIAATVGTSSRLPAGWAIMGPFPALRNRAGELEPWVPAPRFLWVDRRDTGREVPHRATPKALTASTQAASWEEECDLLAKPLPRGNPRSFPWAWVPESNAEPHQGWISASNLDWLVREKGDWRQEKSTRDSLPPFVLEEERYGIAIEGGKAADQMLFMGIHHRLKRGSALLGCLHGAPLDQLVDSVVATGKKGRLVGLRALSSAEQHNVLPSLLRGDHLPALPPDELLVWVSLLTPAFATGTGNCHPFGSLTLDDVRLDLCAVLASAGPEIGGFDHAAGGGRPVRATWAPGSSWGFRLHGGSREQRGILLKQLASNPITTHPEEERFGFAQRIVTAIDPTTNAPYKEEEHHG